MTDLNVPDPFVLARDVVVERRSLDPEPAGEPAHREGVDPALVGQRSRVPHWIGANARSKVGVVTTAQLVRTLAPRLPEPEGQAQTDE